MEYNMLMSEFEAVQKSIQLILTQAVESIELTDTIPPINDITDSNKVFKGKLSVLFVDMRKSTDLTDELKSKKMVKIYRAFIRIIIQAVRYCGGESRQFAGDGVLAVFQDTIENDQIITSSQKAINAARYILTIIDFCLNPLLKKLMENITIGCGIGISTGVIMVTKVGMRGKESDESVENELGIVWVGSTTNSASRFCSLATPGEIFIDETTYNEIENVDKWGKVSRIKGTKIFTGYLSQEYYLLLPGEIEQEPVKSEDLIVEDISFVRKIFEDTTKTSLKLIDEINEKSSALSLQIEKNSIKENQLNARDEQLKNKGQELYKLEERLQSKLADIEKMYKQYEVDEYNFYKDIFQAVHCKKTFAIGMEIDFWNQQLTKIIRVGDIIGKDEKTVKSEICYALVSLYNDLNMYEELYEAVCIQAETYSWIHANTVENAIKKSGHWITLQNIITGRLKTALLPEIRKSLEECLLVIGRLGH